MLECCKKALQLQLQSTSVEEEEFEIVHVSGSETDIFELFSCDPECTQTYDNILEKLWEKSPKKCAQIIINLRNKNVMFHWSRDLPIKCIIWLRKNHPRMYLTIIEDFIRVGYYKDLLIILDELDNSADKLGTREYIELEIFAEVLNKDYQELCEIATASGRTTDHEITMCAKWAPSEHKKWTKYAIRISKLINPGKSRHREFYRDILTRLRGYLKTAITETQNLVNIEKSTMPFYSLMKYQGSFVCNNNWTERDEHDFAIRTVKRLSRGYNVDEKYITYIYEILSFESTFQVGSLIPECNIKLSSITEYPLFAPEDNVVIHARGNFSNANLKLLFIIYYLYIYSKNNKIIIESMDLSKTVDEGISLNNLIKELLQFDSKYDEIELHICFLDRNQKYIWYPLRSIKIDSTFQSYTVVQGIHPIIFNMMISGFKVDFFDFFAAQC